jgi:hypothetical protein
VLTEPQAREKIDRSKGRLLAERNSNTEIVTDPGDVAMENLTRRRFVQAAAMAMAAEPLCEGDSVPAPVYTGVYPLDGTDWLLDIDSSNTGATSAGLSSQLRVHDR